MMTTTIYMGSFHGWVFKRLDCELIGAHFSLLFCQIQSSFLVSLLFLVLGCPLGIIEPIAYMPSPHAIRVQSLHWLQHCSSHHHVKFRTSLHHRHHQHSTLWGRLVMLQGRDFKHPSCHLCTQVSTLWNHLLKSHCWFSLPVPMPHVLLLGKCLLQPPLMDPFYLTFHSIVNNYWEWIVHLFSIYTWF